MDKSDRATVLTVKEVQSILRLSKNKAYELIADSNCPFRVIKIGHVYRVPADTFWLWLEHERGPTS